MPAPLSTHLSTGRAKDSLGTGAKERIAYAVLTIAFCLLLVWIHPQYGGDPSVYAIQIVTFLQQPSLAATRDLLEFGHLLWRPAVAVTTVLFGPAISGLLGTEPRLMPLAAQIGLSAIFSWLAVLLVYRIARILSGSVMAGAVVALSFVTTNAMFTYMRSGYSYLPGAAIRGPAFPR